MNHLEEHRIEISQKLKQLELNKEINSLRKYEELKKEIKEELKEELKEEPKKIIYKVLNYFNNIFNKMFSRYSIDINEDI